MKGGPLHFSEHSGVLPGVSIEFQTQKGEGGMNEPQKPLSRPKLKSVKALACLKGCTLIPFKAVNRLKRELDWQAHLCKFPAIREVRKTTNSSNITITLQNLSAHFSTKLLVYRSRIPQSALRTLQAQRAYSPKEPKISPQSLEKPPKTRRKHRRQARARILSDLD